MKLFVVVMVCLMGLVFYGFSVAEDKCTAKGGTRIKTAGSHVCAKIEVLK